jgi:hypothetical protein
MYLTYVSYLSIILDESVLTGEHVVKIATVKESYGSQGKSPQNISASHSSASMAWFPERVMSYHAYVIMRCRPCSLIDLSNKNNK